MTILNHVCVGTDDMARATAFYNAALGELGIGVVAAHEDRLTMYGKDAPEFFVLRPANGQPATFANGGTIGFRAETPDAVDRFHAAGMANGGRDEGAPGPRDFAPNAYAAYMRDPDGNKVCAVCFGGA